MTVMHRLSKPPSFPPNRALKCCGWDSNGRMTSVVEFDGTSTVQVSSLTTTLIDEQDNASGC